MASSAPAKAAYEIMSQIEEDEEGRKEEEKEEPAEQRSPRNSSLGAGRQNQTEREASGT